MLFAWHRVAGRSRHLQVLAVLLVAAVGFLPNSFTTCAAVAEEGCACCGEPAVPIDTCCAPEEPAAAHEAPVEDGRCCLITEVPLASWTSTTPSASVPALELFLLPAPWQTVAAQPARALATTVDPMSSGPPLRLQLCCFLA